MRYYTNTEELKKVVDKKADKVWSKEYFRPLINDRLKQEFKTGLCNCDSCGSFYGSDGCSSQYHGQYIYHIKKLDNRWLWCYEDDLNHGDI